MPTLNPTTPTPVARATPQSRACSGGCAHPRRRRRNAPLGLAAASAAAVMLALSCTALLGASSGRTPDHDYDAPEPGSYALPVLKPAADGAVLDTDGTALRLADLTRGRVTVMSFIYSRCAVAKACPYATGVLLQLHRQSAEDPALAAGLRLISLSFDPENDTPRRMAAYLPLARSDKPAADWRFLTTRGERTLAPILQAYGQAVDRKQNPNDPAGPLHHTLRVFLIDPNGRIRNIYSSATLDLRLVLADVKTLLMEADLAR